MKVEYRIREVKRYIVTRYHDDGKGGGGVNRVTGEYDNADMAYEVGTALARQEHSNLGYSIGDERIKYPEYPQGCDKAVDAMVNKFLAWKLPKDFSPDAGISFSPPATYGAHWPTGTNLFNAQQSKSMFEYLIEK